MRKEQTRMQNPNPELKFKIVITKVRITNREFLYSEFERLLTIAYTETKSQKKRDFLSKCSYYIGDFSTLKAETYQNEKRWLEKQENNESYFVLLKDQEILIDSKSGLGYLIAIYKFFEILGFIFFYPGKNFEFFNDEALTESNIKDISTFSVRKTPLFKKRGIILNVNARNLMNWIDFAPKIGLNTVAIDYFNKKVEEQAQKECSLRGLSYEVRAHSLGSDFCMHKQLSFDTSESNLMKYLQHVPEHQSNIYCHQFDGFHSKCSCTTIEKLTCFSNQLMNRLNLLIQNPLIPSSKLLFYLATKSSWKIPKVLPHPRLGLIMMPTHRCLNHPINSEICKFNKLLVYPQILKYMEIFRKDGMKRQIEVIDSWFDSDLFSKKEFAMLGLKIREGTGRLPISIKTMIKDITFFSSLKIDAYMLYARNLDSYYFNHLFSPQINLIGKIFWGETEIDPALNSIIKFFFGENIYKDLSSINENFDTKHLIMSSILGYKRIIKRRITKINGLLTKQMSPIQRKFLKLYLKEMEFLLQLKARNPLLYLGAWIRLAYQKFKMTRS